MNWSTRIGEWFGIEVRVHATFGLLLLWVATSALSDTGSLLAVAVNLALVAAVFAFVVLHEYGHALTARRFGVRTRGITLYPIGGVAMLERMPREPVQELLIAVAGPAVNFALAAGLWLASQLLFGGVGPLGGLLIGANLVMGLFNLVPALPMDGGRMLRAGLSMRMDSARATALAARVARVVAVAMGLLGAFWDGHGMLMFIALFVWLAAGSEERAARVAQFVEQRARGPRRVQVFRASEPLQDEEDGLHVVFGPDGRRIFVGRL